MNYIERGPRGAGPRAWERLFGPDRGRRVRLVSTSDLHTKLRPGAEGTVLLTDAMGTLHVAWEDGSRLGLIPGEDSWEWLAADYGKENAPEFLPAALGISVKPEDDVHLEGAIPRQLRRLTAALRGPSDG